MKRKILRNKRKTFIRILVPYVVTAIVISLIFSVGFREYLYKYTQSSLISESERNVSQTISKINELNSADKNTIQQMQSYLSQYTHFNVGFDNLAMNEPPQILSNFTKNSYVVSAIFDKNNNIVASNSEKIIAMIKLSDNDSDWYFCDWDSYNIPQLDELFNYYHDLKDNIDFSLNYYLTLESAYINKSNNTLVPNRCSMEISRKVDGDNTGVLGQYEFVESKDFTIEFDDPNYELINFNQRSSGEYPIAFLAGYDGVDKDVLNEVTADMSFPSENPLWSMTYHSKDLNGESLLCVETQNIIYIDGEKYCLNTAFIADENCDVIMKIYWRYTAVFSLIMLAAAFLLSWLNNAINKARYAFEDYQKALINNLAHDLKTPMAAIGGYAENAKMLIEKETSENVVSFLDAITENVFYIDNIVNRTLELNHLNKIREVKKELVQMHKIVEKSIEKYTLILDEKNVAVELNGEFELMADRATIESAIENLISNAVKYTAKNGKILITADKNSLTITNDTEDNVNTENLTMPFVKGDKARNDKSSGIGLAIVQSAADLNDLKFTISSSEKKFKAILSK